MTLQRTLPRLVAIALAAAASVGMGCGGGSDTTSSGPVAAFTPDTASPGPASIALLPNTANGASVTVRVTVTGVPSFFGAAFRLKYDATALLFSGMTDTASFLRNGITSSSDVLFLADSTTQSGEIFITATRINPVVAPPVAVTATADLVVLTFIARKVIVPTATEGRLDFSDPKQVCDGTTTPTGCGAVTVMWSGGAVSAQ